MHPQPLSLSFCFCRHLFLLPFIPLYTFIIPSRVASSVRYFQRILERSCASLTDFIMREWQLNISAVCVSLITDCRKMPPGSVSLTFMQSISCAQKLIKYASIVFRILLQPTANLKRICDFSYLEIKPTIFYFVFLLSVFRVKQLIWFHKKMLARLSTFRLPSHLLSNHALSWSFHLTLTCSAAEFNHVTKIRSA